MSEPSRGLVWDEIRGFASPGEYRRFVCYLEDQIANGHARELPSDPDYVKGMISGGRWFEEAETGSVWRLVEPDFPFRGLWEPVRSSWLSRQLDS